MDKFYSLKGMTKEDLNELVLERNILKRENQLLKEVYKKTINHLFNIGNDELARYMQAQIFPNSSWIPQKIESNDIK